MEFYIKKKWAEENVVYYLHFYGETAIRQIEVWPDEVIILSEEYPIQGEAFLYDQDLSSLDLDKENYISKEEFEKVWDKVTK